MISVLKSFFGLLALLCIMFNSESFAGSNRSVTPGLKVTNSKEMKKEVGDIAAEFHINGLDEYRGLMATVFYVSAREAGIRTAGARPRVRLVMKASQPIEIHGNGELVNIPEAIIPRASYFQYNYVFVVVHSPYVDKIGIRNLDGSVPDGQEGLDLTLTDEQSPFNHKDLFVLSKLELSGNEKGGNIVTLKPKKITYKE